MSNGDLGNRQSVSTDYADYTDFVLTVTWNPRAESSRQEQEQLAGRSLRLEKEVECACGEN